MNSFQATHTHTINSLFDSVETESLDFWTQNRNVNNKSVIVSVFFLCCQFVARSSWSCVGPFVFSHCLCISPKWEAARQKSFRRICPDSHSFAIVRTTGGFDSHENAAVASIFPIIFAILKAELIFWRYK